MAILNILFEYITTRHLYRLTRAMKNRVLTQRYAV